MAGVPADYHRSSVAEKQRMQREQMRAPSIACPYCETKTGEQELLEHVDQRCTGRRPVHPRSRWLSWREAMELGVSESTLRRWVDLGLVRIKGQRWKRRYLLRDVVCALVLQKQHPRLRKTAMGGGFR